ncbi:hypothetical protein R9X47_29005 [Wukongibacter baidiensis]|uniref:hypothetical protein n=1 Tax=Wukongibacter baidiensis TaxID=1723361 RepID=UPI003D7F5725
MWNNQFGYYPPMMRGYGKNYDEDLCLYYEKEKVYYDNRYPECFKDALKDLECQKVNVSLTNGDTYDNVTLDEVNRDYIAVRKNDCAEVCLIPMNKICSVCCSDDLAKDLWGQRIKKAPDNNNKYYYK